MKRFVQAAALFWIRLLLLVATAITLMVIPVEHGTYSSPAGSPLVVFHRLEWVVLPLLAFGWVLERGASRALRRERDRNRHLDEPTEMLPVLDDPLARHFNEAERILRGETDPDFAWLADRRRLRPYEVEFQTAEIRKLTRRLARLDQT